MPVDSLMPKKKKSGGAGFVTAGVVMLLLMGGLIYYRLRQNDEPIVLPVQSAAVESVQPPPLEAPPPPPPPLEEVDAGQEPKTTKAKRTTGGGMCDAECTGKDSAQLRSALAGRGAQARGCYERVLRTNPNLAGRLMVSARIGPGGQICSLRVADQGLGDQGVATCVQRMFQTGGFPPPAGGCVDVQVPLNFVQKR